MVECGKLSLIVGPMFSGKTSELINRYEKSQRKDMNPVMIKHSIDNRYNDKCVVSHTSLYGNSISIPKCVMVEKLADLKLDDMSKELYIDEIHFFSDKHLCHDLLSRGFNVTVSGLNSDYKLQPFKGFDILFALASSITLLKSVCHYCKDDARFTLRIDSNDDTEIVVGGQESYKPVCFKCHPQCCRSSDSSNDNDT